MAELIEPSEQCSDWISKNLSKCKFSENSLDSNSDDVYLNYLKQDGIKKKKPVTVKVW